MKRILIATVSLAATPALAQSTFQDSCGSVDWFATCTFNNACGPGQNGCLNNWFASFGCGTDCPLPFPGSTTNVVIPAGPTITMSDGSADINSLDCNRPFTLGGSIRIRENSTIRAGLNWTRGGLSVVTPGTEYYFPAGSTLSISGADGKSIIAARLVLDQAAVWSGGSIGLGSGAQIVSNAFFNVNCDATISHTGGNAVSFENYGEFRKLAGAGTTIVGLTFNNYDEIIVSNGTVRMSNSGTCRGPITLDGPSVLETAFGNYNFAAGTSVQGAGLLRVNGQLNLLDPVTVDNIELLTSLNGPGDLRVLLDMHWRSGTMAGVGVTRIPSFAALRLTGNDGKTMINRQIANEGAMTITGGALNLSSSSVVNNSGTLDLQSDTSINFIGGSQSLVENSGTLRKSGGGGTSVIGATLNSTGAVDVRTGTLRLSNSGLANGPVSIAANSALEFAFGNYNLGDGASITGEGEARFNGGTNLLAMVPIENSELTTSLTGPGDLIVTDTMRWLSGSMAGGGVTCIPSFAALRLTGNDGKTMINRQIANEGAMTIAGGALNLSSASVVNNSGTLDLQSDTSINFVGGSQSFVENSGTLRKSGGSGTSIIGATFNSTGAVDVQSGTLRLSNGGISTGSFELSPAAVLDFSFGNYRFDTGSAVTGDGLARMNGTTILLDDVPFENVELTSRLVGPGDLVIQNQMLWTNGTMDSGGATVIPAEATLNISGSASKSLRNRTLSNAGHITVDGTGGIDASLGGGIVNDGLFDLLTSATISYSGGTLTSFENHGAFRKLGSASLSVMSGIPFNNHGRIELQAGTLRMSNSGTNFGQIDIAGGAVLETSFGTYRLADGSSVTGDGITLINGDVTILGDASVERLEVLANVRGSGNLHVTRDMNWSGASMLDSGTTTVEPAASLVVSGNNAKAVSGRTIRNRGNAAITGTGTIAFVSGGSFLNEGTLDLLTGNALVYQGGAACQVSNTGSISKKIGSGTSQIANMPLKNSGSIEVLGGSLVATNLVQSGGATRVTDGATLQCTQPMSLGGGTLSGSGQVIGSVTNTAGRTQPGDGIGRLSVSSNYSQGSSAVLDIEIDGTGAATGHDQLAIGGAATLGGELQLTFAGGFTPQPGDSFTVLTAASINGTFVSVVGAGQFDVAYMPTSVVVTVVAPPCVGDLNGDLQVNLTDLSTLLANFGLSGGATLAQGDLNGDGNVNLTDLALLLGNFGLNC
ncbi:MAG: beta strand repeat-containing protein [Phycisphaerae bacterium]